MKGPALSGSAGREGVSKKRLALFGTRLAVGAGLAAFVAWVLLAAPLWVFAAVTLAFVGVALNEFFEMVRRKGIFIERWIGLSVGLVIPLSIHLGFESTKGWELFFMVVAFLTLFILQLRRRDSSEAIVGISTALFGIFYVSWCFSFLIKLRYLTGPAGLADGWLVAYLVLVTKAGDIGAYAVGSLFGRHILIRRISPGKTWEGALGGLSLSFLATLAFRPVFDSVSLFHLLGLGLALGITGQLGDLSESLIKRDCQVKDSGVFFPGLGGVLDVIDSLLFASPLCYFYMLKFWGLPS